MSDPPRPPDPRHELIRIGSSNTPESDHACPLQLRLKSRPRIRPNRPWTPRERWVDFTLHPITEALDRIETGSSPQDIFRGLSEDTCLHPLHRQYAVHAVATYLRTYADDMAVPHLPYWVLAKDAPPALWELYAWGRRYVRCDGRVREHRFLRHGSRSREPRPGDQVAVAALATAFGQPAEWPSPWWEPFVVTGQEPAPELVMVTEIRLDTGETDMLFRGTPAEARARYDTDGAGSVRAVAHGEQRRPSSACHDCKDLAGCPQVQRVPGAFGPPTRDVPLRTMSVTDLRVHRECPAKYFARKLHLPTQAEYSRHAALGQAVHAWLAERHRRAPRGCVEADLPRDASWIPERSADALPLEAQGRAMLARHLDSCPLAGPRPDEVLPEPTRSWYDEESATLAIATPDLLLRRGADWIWHEVKTTVRRPWQYTDTDLLHEFPQAAFAVVMLAAGVFGETGVHMFTLETLTPKRVDVHNLDPGDPQVRRIAAKVLTERFGPWRTDRDFTASPGPHCDGLLGLPGCEYRHWCPHVPVGEVAGPE